MIKRLSNGVTSRPKIALSLLLIFTLLPAYFAAKGLSLTVKLEEMLPSGAKNVELFWRFSEQFGGANTTLIEIRTKKENIYNKEFLEKYKRVSDEIYYHKDTIRHLVQSLTLRKTKAVSGSGGRVNINALMWPDIPATEEELKEVRKAVNNQYRGFLVADDEKSAMIIAEFNESAKNEEILSFVEELRKNEEDEYTTIHVVGRPILLGNIYNALDEVVLLLLISLFFVIVILYGYFRTWIGVVAPLSAAIVATIWGLGVMGFFDYNLDPLLVLLPAFVFAIVISHGVQLTSRVLEEIESGCEMRQAVRNSLNSTLVPSSAAIITDAAGFGVLGLVAIPSIKALAMICGVWLLSILPALVFAASVLCLMPKPKSHNRHSALLESFWKRMISLERHKYIIFTVTMLLLAIGISNSKNLDVGDSKGSSIPYPQMDIHQK